MSLLTLIGRSAWGSLAVGLVFGAFFYFVHIAWITRYLGVVPWFALGGLETLFMGLGAIPITLAYRWMPRALPARWAQLTLLPLLVAGLWTARELFMGSWPYTGFPWARLGMSQSESPLAHVASWVGVTGLTFLMVALCAAVIEWGAQRAVQGPAHRAAVRHPRAPRSRHAGVADVRRRASCGSAARRGTARRATSTSERRTPCCRPSSMRPLRSSARTSTCCCGRRAASTRIRSDNESTASVLDALAERVDAPLLVNAATTRGEDIFNTSMLWVGGEGAVQLHDKRNPVPMGEYVPDRPFFEALAPDLIGLIQREYTPGTNPPLIDLDGVGIGLAICFDVIYDGVIWEGARDGAQVYMFQTNNADFRDTDENLQQLAFARMRAIETGRSVVNISTVGTSQVIGPDGTTIDALPAGEAGHMLTDVELRTGLTPAVLLGPWVQVLIGWGSVAALVAARRRRPHPRTQRDAGPDGADVSRTKRWSRRRSSPP